MTETSYLKKKEADLQGGLIDNYRDRYQSAHGLIYQDHWNQLLLKGLPSQQDLTVLDLGCGTGILLKELSNRYNYVYGLDISPELIASIKFGSPHIKEVKVADAEDIPFSEAKFDLIFSRGVLHHLPNPEKAVISVGSKLKKGGWFILSEPCHDSFLLRLPRKIVIKHSANFGEIHRAFPSKYLVRLLRKSGFELKSLERFGFLAFPICGLSDHSRIINYLPAKKQISRLLISLDRLLSSVPLVRTQAWHIIIKAQKI